MTKRGLRPHKVDITPNWLRFRLESPTHFAVMRTAVISPTIEFVYGKLA